MYEGSNISREEGYLLILSFAIRHNLTNIALEQLISLIDVLLPYSVFHSRYLFLKEYKSFILISKCYYCPSCHILLNISNYKENATVTCPECKETYVMSFLTSNMHYFLRLPLKNQLQSIVDSEIYNLFDRTSNFYLDVCSGTFYKSLAVNGIISKNDITLQFNTDGVKICRSSSMTLWPIQVCINELPYKIRKDKMILCGLWYGRDKPNMHLFLNSFIEELTALHETGIIRNVEGEQEIQIKVHTIVSSVDSMARPLLQEIVQFHGRYGCSFCLHEGRQVPVRKGTTRVYPGDADTLRTIQQHERDCERAMDSGHPVKGIKGPSILMLLPIFDVTTSFTPDYLHSVLLGVAKTFTDAWFDTAYHKKPWYIGTKINVVDRKLLKIRPPCEITRTPRSLSDRKLWKASEWKQFVLYYSLICLQNVMPKRYFKHWFLLVFSMHKFLKNKISDVDFYDGENVRTFVFQIDKLYGIEFYRFNTHLMIHIPESVKKFGALWATSTFPFEHYNGVLGKMFKSPQTIPEQICKSYVTFKNGEQLSTAILSNVHCPEVVKTLYHKMCGIFLSQRCISYGSSLKLFGSPAQIYLSLIEKTAIRCLLNVSVIDTADSYNRFIINNTLWHIENSEQLKKRHNSTAKLINGMFITVQAMLAVHIELESELKYIVIGQILERCNSQICNTTMPRLSSKNLFFICCKTNQIIAILPDMLDIKCIKMPYSRLEEEDRLGRTPLRNYD